MEHKEKYKTPIDIVIDEGRQKPVTFQNVTCLKDIAKDAKVNYESSVNSILIQLADFVAFVLNKSQMIAVKSEKSRYEIKLFINYF